MSDIQRLRICVGMDRVIEFSEDDGDYVRYSDIAELQAEILKKDEELKGAERVVAWLKSKVANHESCERSMRDALMLYQSAGFGHSTDFFKQGLAYDAAVEALGVSPPLGGEPT